MHPLNRQVLSFALPWVKNVILSLHLCSRDIIVNIYFCPWYILQTARSRGETLILLINRNIVNIIDAIMLTGSSENTSTFRCFRHTSSRECPLKFEHLPNQEKFLGVQRPGKCWDFLSKVKDTLALCITHHEERGTALWILKITYHMWVCCFVPFTG